MIDLSTTIILYGTFLVLAAKRLMTYMHVLQQEEYDNSRLTKWIFQHGAFDKRLSFGLIIASIAWPYVPTFFMGFIVFILMVIVTYLEVDPRKSSKKKLVMTSRVKRIFYPSIIVIALMGTWPFFAETPHNTLPWPWIIVMQLIPITLLVINMFAAPFEMIIQKMYWNEAKQKMNELNPMVIGITGSFGKTSIKHILGHILSTKAEILMTPGSVNTSMGITRIIREQLTEDHKFFLVEMGAYDVGSIRDLCKLTPPDHGIISAIGHSHYERFGSLKAVAKAKFELAEAVIQRNNGKVIIHERTLKHPRARSIKLDYADHFVVCGEPPNIAALDNKDTNYLEKGDIHIYEVKQSANGLEIKIGVGDKIYNLSPPLFGIHHGHNVALATALAMEVGMEIGDIQLALMSLPQIAHRLELKRNQEDGITIIDDAYNSNPMGFRSALDLLTLIDNGGRKILVTPGIIELGIAHDEVHDQLGQYAGQVCDIALIVNPSRIPTFISGFKATGAAKTLVEVESFAEASKWMAENKQEKDLILLENDLPDMYENIPKM